MDDIPDEKTPADPSHLKAEAELYILSKELRACKEIITVQNNCIDQLKTQLLALHSLHILTEQDKILLADHEEDLWATEVLLGLSEFSTEKRPSDTESEQKAKRRRGKLPESATVMLKDWFFNHRFELWPNLAVTTPTQQKRRRCTWPSPRP